MRPNIAAVHPWPKEGVGTLVGCRRRPTVGHDGGGLPTGKRERERERATNLPPH